MANSKVSPRHLLAISRQHVFVRSPLLVFDFALGSALLALGDADEGVDDTDQEECTADTAADGVLGGVGEAGPFFFGLLGFGEFVEGFVDCGFASGGFVSLCCGELRELGVLTR